MSASWVETMLVEALESITTRRLAKVVIRDVRRMRLDAPLPDEREGLLTLLREELTDACYLRLGPAGARAVSALEDRVHAMAALPRELWGQSPERLVLVGGRAESGAALAAALGITDVVRVSELFELLLAVDDEVRTCVVIDARDSPIEHATLASFAPDFPRNVSVVVASMDPGLREAFVRTGAAFRTTLRPEPVDDLAITESARAALRGRTQPAEGPSSVGSTTSTFPARAA